MTLESQIAETLHQGPATLHLIVLMLGNDDSLVNRVGWILFSRSRFVRNTDGTWRVN
jgi:hypothetical protein